MKVLSRVALPALLALSVSAAAVLAQAPAGPEGRRPSPEMMRRFEDGKFAMAKATLKLTDEQLKLWAPVEDLLRSRHEERRKRWAERRDKAAGPDGRRAEAVPLPERLERRSEEMIKHAEHTKALATAIRPLFATFNDEQKAVAGPVFAQLMGGGRHGMRGGHHDRGPMMHHRGMMEPGGMGPDGPQPRKG